MAIPDQSKYPAISELARKSPMLSNLPPDHQAWIHPMQSYIWMHDLYQGCYDILGIEMPKEQYKRLDLLKTKRFLEDHSGRSTGKSHNYLTALAITSICLPRHKTVWLGQEKEVGIEVFDKYYGEWINFSDNFRRFVTTPGQHKPRVSHTQAGASVRFHDGSRVIAISPNPNKDYNKMQTRRYNHGIFNEWTSWPHIREIPDKIEPIFTNTNLQYRHTRLLRESMEKSLGIQLGYLTNENLQNRHREEDYLPRDYMEGITPDQWKVTLEKFYRNFEITFGFDYRHGINHKSLKFPPLKGPNDLIMFFRNYDEGDPAYLNKLIYDGTAKKPSDDCHWLHEYFEKKIKQGERLYGIYCIGIDDIPTKWDGIIYDSTIVEKARNGMLKEDFDRIWNGQWLEGRAKKPFPWTDIVMACKKGWLGQLARQDEKEIFIGAIDSAQGTDLTFRTPEGIKDGRGDDGVMVIFILGDGTSANPHMLCSVHIAEDIRSEPMAFDVQKIETRLGAAFYMMDPGGGGKGVMEKLAKPLLEKTDAEGNKEVIQVTPMVPWDHIDPGDAKPIICIFSLSNELITSAYIDSKTGKSMLQYQEQLNNRMVTLMQEALNNGSVIFPEHLDQEELVALHNNNVINNDQLMNLLDINTALAQLAHINYVTDRQGKRIKNERSGVFSYKSSGKKDAAWTILMAHMMCDILVRYAEVQAKEDEDKDFYPTLL